MTPKTQKTGKTFEALIEGIIDRSGYRLVSSEEFEKHEGNEAIYATQFPVGKDLYRSNRRADFILFHPSKWNGQPLVIECKMQVQKGSVDKKFPYEVMSVKLTGYSTIFILGGEGHSSGSRKWLESNAIVVSMDALWDFLKAGTV